MPPAGRFAVDLADRVGRLLLRVRRNAVGLPPDEVKLLGDRSAQAEIVARFAAALPDDAVLSEEAADDRARLGRDRVWIVDPLDGTREFAEGRADWAVHVALWQRDGCRDGTDRGGTDGGAGSGGDGAITVGAVSLPDEGVVLSSADRPAMPARPGGPLRVAVSRSRPPTLVTGLVERLADAGVPAELVPMGSAGAKIAAVVRGRVDAYVHGGGQYEWDSAAPVCVARAAGAHTSRLDGAALRYNQPDPYLPDLLVCRPEYADAILAALRR